VHRYTFDGTGTTVMDSIGTAHGIAVNTTLPGTGVLPLSGGTNDASDQYVELPAGILNGLTDITVEVWVNWTDGLNQWQRIFDFGSSTEMNQGDSYLFLAPYTLRAAYKPSGGMEVFVDGPALPTVAKTHVAVVVDDTQNSIRLYLNGAFESSVTFNGSLSELTYDSNWIGRSHYFVDPAFGGNIREFRIYNAALTNAQIATSALADEDPDFLAEP
jgi:hypothetical protein